MIASALLSIVFAAGVDCPLGAEYAFTVDELRGACALGADGAGFLVCTPESQSPAGQLTKVEQSTTSGESSTQTQRAYEGPLACAVDVDVATDGSIAVADAIGVVQVARGGVWSAYGSGILEQPSGVAWRGSELAVSDRRLRAVIVFGADGAQRQRIGTGQLRDPRGLACTIDGSIYVADRLADCLWYFASQPDGALPERGVRIGEMGVNPGQFSAPSDIAIRENGGERCLFVADELNHRVQLLDGRGGFLGFFGMHALIPRLGEGRIHYPRSVALGADGVLLAVAEAFEDRVQFFRLTSVPTPPSGTKSVELISSHFGSDIACADDLLAVVDVESEAVAVLDARTTPPIHMSIMGGGGASPFRFQEVSALAIEPGATRVWIADRGHDRVDVYDIAWNRSKDPVVDMFMPRLARSMELTRLMQQVPVPPVGVAWRVPDITDIAFDPQTRNQVLLLDSANLAIWTTDLRFTGGNAEFLPKFARAPEEMALAADGRIAVVDPVAQRVFLRAKSGEWTTIDRLGGIMFVRPCGVAFASNGELVVTDSARDACIVQVGLGGARVVGERGVLDEQFWDPQAIAASSNGLLVIDRGNHRFQRFGEGFVWNLTGSLGRYHDRKRRGSPGGPPVPSSSLPARPIPEAKGDAS